MESASACPLGHRRTPSRRHPPPAAGPATATITAPAAAAAAACGMAVCTAGGQCTHTRPRAHTLVSVLMTPRPCLPYAVKGPKLSEKEQEAAEAKNAVADLAKFDERFPQ